jgi:hypothetical protein
MANDQEQRVPLDVTVRVYGMDLANKPFSKSAHTVNIGKDAVCLSGVDVALKVDDIVGVQYGNEKARFRIASAGPAGTAQAGLLELCCVQPDKNIWGDLITSAPAQAEKAPAPKPDVVPERKQQVAQATENRNRRRFERFKCDLGILAQSESDGTRSWGRCTDLSRGGCYVETWSPAQVDTVLNLTFEGMVVRGVVSAFHPNVGMGISFVAVSNPQQLDSLLGALKEARDRQ